MDDFLQSSAPWQLKFVVCLAAGLIVALAILSISKKRLARLSQKPFCSPNWISLYRFPLFWLGVSIFFSISPFWGCIIVIAACVWDVVDGKMSVGMAEAGIFRSRLDRWIGEWLDPLVDKLTVLPLLIIFTAKGLVDWRVTGVIVALDSVGTLLRDPIVMLPVLLKSSDTPLTTRILAELDRREAKQAASPAGRNKASPAGKIKMLVLCGGILACMPYHLGWIKEPRIQSWVLALAAFLGLMSILSRVKVHSAYSRFMDWLATYFTHKDVL
ncbi:MAG: CDP-alcohol phosphatidyltransferase family protein [Patescibacteria group bacterium]